MKRGLFLVATVTLGSALYAQGVFTPAQARQLVAEYNPSLLARADQNPDVEALLQELLSSYIASSPAPTLANRATLIALARNFDNSIALHAAVENYKTALRYSQVGGNVASSAQEAAQRELSAVYPRIWAVSVQTKEDLLDKYKVTRTQLKQDKSLPVAQQAARLQAVDASIASLQQELKNLNTRVGEQLVLLTQSTLSQAQADVLAEMTAVRETPNLQIKTKHKKPVAE